MDYHPTSPEERISAFRKIVEKKAYAKIDGFMVDLFTANYVVQIYDMLNDTNKQKYANHKANCMANIAFQLVEKVEGSHV